MFWQILRFPMFAFRKIFSETCTMVLLFDNGTTIRVPHVTNVNVVWEGQKLTKCNFTFLIRNGFRPVLCYDLDRVVGVFTE